MDDTNKSLDEIKRREESKKRQLANLIPAKKGEIRNPNGRPKKEFCFTQLVKDRLAEIAEIKDKNGNDINPNKKTYFEILADATVNHAIKGNSFAVEQIWNRVDGKVQENVKIDMQAKVTNESREEDSTIKQALSILDESTRQRVHEALKLALKGDVEGTA